MGWIPTRIEHWSDPKHISFLIFINPCAWDNYATNEVLIKKVLTETKRSNEYFKSTIMNDESYIIHTYLSNFIPAYEIRRLLNKVYFEHTMSLYPANYREMLMRKKFKEKKLF